MPRIGTTLGLTAILFHAPTAALILCIRGRAPFRTPWPPTISTRDPFLCTDAHIYALGLQDV